MTVKPVHKEFVTAEYKQALFKRKKYSCDPPPVSTGKWNDQDWIKWIDSHGRWWVNFPEPAEK